MAKRDPVARLTLVVEWHPDMDLPDNSEIEEILDKCREHASIKQATFETFRLTKKELI